MNFNYSDIDKLQGSAVRRFLARLFLSLCVIGVGVGYIGNQVPFLPWENFTLFFPGWGALFLIIPAIYFLLHNKWSWFWAACLVGGILILCFKLDVMPMKNAWIIVLGLLLIFIGLRILLNPFVRRWRARRLHRNARKYFSYSADASFDIGDKSGYSVSFNEKRIDMTGQNFTSGTLSVDFGSMTFDLRNALVQDNSVIDARCNCGELTILLPKDVRAEVTSACNFGSCRNKKKRSDEAWTQTVYINVSCAFGSVDIR